jgi:tetratricopeptide (TPR) repeat protein
MASDITTITELLYKFHSCEMHIRQGKIATCLIAFKDVIEKMPGIPKTEKEKNELRQGIEVFLKNLSSHKKFQEIFGEVSFGDTDLETNLEFIKSMIVAQEQEIIDKYHKDEEVAEAQRLSLERDEDTKKKEFEAQIEETIKAIDEENLPRAMELIKVNEELLDGIILHYNTIGMMNREIKNFEKAIDSYSKALSLSPQDENLHYNVGRVYFEDNKPEKALEYLEKAVKLNPEFKEGKVFYDFLQKFNQAKNNEVKSGGLLKKMFSKKPAA